jgi:hypothetical protein
MSLSVDISGVLFPFRLAVDRRCRYSGTERLNETWLLVDFVFCFEELLEVFGGGWGIVPG